jgi:NADH dehydrogenase FAD-containing subunit
MADTTKKITIALVGGGAANAGVLRTLLKQSDAIKNQLDVVIIDSQDYYQNPAALQRLLAHPEKTPFSVPSWAELQQHLGGWTRFVHGHVATISLKNKVLST